MTGFKVASIYAVLYAVLSAINSINVIIDVKFISCILVSIVFIGWLSSNLSYKSAPAIVLLFSLISSTSLILIQYLFFLWASDFAYNETNAIISKILPALTIIDVLAMIWITLDGLYNKSQSRDDGSDSIAGFINSHLYASRKGLRSGEECQSR